MQTVTQFKNDDGQETVEPNTAEPKSRNGRAFLVALLEGIQGMAFVAGSVVIWPLLHSVLENRGSTTTERNKTWPGDDALPTATSEVMRALDINALAEVIWKWLVQLGSDRAGFYSCELLENLVGCRVRNIEKIVPQFQRVEEGQFIPIHPSGAGFWVQSLEINRHLVFRSWTDEQNIESRESAAKNIWGFQLEPSSPTRCRIVAVSSGQLGRNSLWLRLSTRFLLAPIHFAMEQKMLYQIRHLAEASAGKASLL